MPVGTPIELTDAVVRDISRFIEGKGKGQAQSAVAARDFMKTRIISAIWDNHYGQIVVTLPEDKNRNFPHNPKK